MKRRKLNAERLEARLVMDGGFASCPSFGSSQFRQDVNLDGYVTPRDSLMVINAVAGHDDGAPDSSCEENDGRVDVNRDGDLTPSDALVVINFLDRLDRNQTELDSARAKWENNGFINYNLTYNVIRQALPEPTTVVVRDGVPRSPASTLDELEPSASIFSSALTVNGLFSAIQNAIDRQYSWVGVNYDDVTGAPISGTFDPIGFGVDEEYYLRVSSLTESTADLVEGSSALESARSLWRSTATMNYDLEYRGNSPAGSTINTVEVRDGIFQSPVGATGRLPDGSFDTRNLSVEGLFDLIENAIDNDYEIRDVVFDKLRGYPVFLSIDAESSGAEGEIVIDGVDFRFRYG